MKVQDLAKQLGESPKDLMSFLFEHKIRVKSFTSKLDRTTVQRVRNLHQERKNQEKNVIEIGEEVMVELTEYPKTLGELIDKTSVSMAEMMRVVLEKGLLLNVNSEIEPNLAISLSESLKVTLIVESQEEKVEADSPSVDEKLLKARPPVITIMGHVDHGKTLLLDALRESRIVEKEAGGITQHIGAYQIEFQDKKITFLDTPGHEAFTAIRARGADLTDIVILVVAADDGVKPQTIEALNHAKAAKVPIIVAINKIDKPEANIDQCKQQLSQHDLVAEDWGGDTVMVPLSAKTKKGLDDLLEMINLVSDVQDLKANYEGLAEAVVIESKLTVQQGAQTTILVRSGMLRRGDLVACGSASGKVRALINDRGETIQEAEPGMPVTVVGLDKVPSPGETLRSFNQEKDLKKSLQDNQAFSDELNKTTIAGVTLETLSDQVRNDDLKSINLILKADVTGTLEAIIHSIKQITSESITIKILHAATGNINENDIRLAHTTKAIVLGFNVKQSNEARNIADQLKVQVKDYSIIYKLLDDIKDILSGLYSVELIENKIGQVEIREIFKFSKVGMIAGSYVLSGKVIQSAKVKIYRGKDLVGEAQIASLKRFKDDVKEVKEGYECGIVLEDFSDIKKDDQLACFELIERRLDV